MYRTPAETAPIPEVIALSPHRGRRVILGFCLWFVAFWFIVFGPVWVVDAVITGEGYLRLIPALGTLALAVWVIARTMQLETVLVGNTEIRRVGFFRERAMKWRDVTGSRTVRRKRARGAGHVELLMIEGRDGKELLVAPWQVEKPALVFWALERVAADRIDEIDARVRREGTRRSRRVYVAHASVGVTLFVLTAAFFAPVRADHHAERVLRRLSGRPVQERLEVAGAMLDHPLYSDHVECMARSRIVHAHVDSGDSAAATRVCEEMRGESCYPVPYDGCTGIEDAVARAQNVP